MTPAPESLARDPALYPMAFDLARDAILFLRMDEAAYRASSFLDERAVTRGEEQWMPFADVERALSHPVAARPLHFIFHMGHVGSTLLSRLLDETGLVLSLREPLPLRALAEAFDHRQPGIERRLETMLRLWERGFSDTSGVVLKGTSTTERLAPVLLAMRPQAKAVMLNVSAEVFLATAFAAPNSAVDLNAHGPERMHRLARMGAPTPRPATLGELAAMSWLSERMTQAQIARDYGHRVIGIDFDIMLRALEPTISRVLAHLGLDADAGKLANNPVLMRYSKAQEHSYSPSVRALQLENARRSYAAEIRQALNWLDVLASRHAAVNRALALIDRVQSD
jgi:hypothetical protein